MAKFRKKPVVVEAVTAREVIRAASKDWSALPQWIKDAYEAKGPGRGIVFTYESVIIITLEGNMTASIDDWIIQGVKGEIYPCKPDIFADTYEPVE